MLPPFSNSLLGAALAPAPGLPEPGPATRREAAIDRGADAMHGLMEWAPPARKPQEAGFFVTRSKIEPKALSRRVLFTGNFWMADTPVVAWRAPVNSPLEHKHRPVSSIAAAVPAVVRGELREHGAKPAVAKATKFEELALEPMDSMDLEIQALKQVSRLELRVEVVKFKRPAADATGVSAGRVLAVSENFSAQGIGKGQVVIHENNKLDRELRAGEDVTLAYDKGRAMVFDGLAHDIDIVADWMPKNQAAYMRMVMLDALSMMKEPQSDDEKLRDAMRFALESTAKYFGVEETKLRVADISLVVNEKASVMKVEAPDAPTLRGARP